MIRDPNKTAARIARKLARFKSVGLEPVCVDCGCTDPEILVLDHYFGKQNESIVEVRCEYCHKVKHELCLREGINMRREPNVDKRHVMYLRNLAVSFERLAPVVRRLADEIENRKKG